MYIKKLYLNSFGKFHNREIELDSSFNIIHGANESGKSTVHKFIDGMLFGFFKHYAKKRIYSADHRRYQPWKGVVYDGALIYCHNGSEYRIERNFLKGRDSVRIFENPSGRDITSKASYNMALGLHEPATVHFGISHVIYRNTLSVGQLQLKTDSDLAGDVREMLINSESSGSDDISVKKALAALQEKISVIGTPKAKKTKLGGIYDRISILEDELEAGKSSQSSMAIMQKEIDSLKKERDAAESERKTLEEDITILKNEGNKKQYSECLAMKEQADLLFAGAERLRKFSKTDEKQLDRINGYTGERKSILATLEAKEVKILDLQSREAEIREKMKSHSAFEIIGGTAIENLRADFESCGGMRERSNELKRQLEILRNELGKLNDICDTLNEDYQLFAELEKERIRLERPPELIENLRERYGRLRYKKKTYKLLLILSPALTAAGLAAGFLTEPLMFLTAAPGAILAFACYLIYLRIKGIMKDTRDELEENEGIYMSAGKDTEEEMHRILDRNSVDSADELAAKYKAFGNLLGKKPELENDAAVLADQMSNIGNRISEKNKRILFILQSILDRDIGEVSAAQIDEVYAGYERYRGLRSEAGYLRQNIDSLAEEMKERRRELEIKEKEIADILAANEVRSTEEYKEAAENKKMYLEYLNKYEEKMQILGLQLKGMVMEELKERIDNTLPAETVTGLDAEGAEKREDEIKHRIAVIDMEMARLEERIRGIEKNSRPVVDIVTELDCLNEQKQLAEKKTRAYEAAIVAIEKVSAQIRDSFAPGLNRKISAMMNVTSSGRYDEVTVDHEMNVRIFDKENGRTVEIDDLSVGTIDQIYFAVRFSMIDLLNRKDTLPFFLDDPFVNYDRERVANVLRFIHSETAEKDRQVILFTCHEREKEILEDEGLNFKYIRI